MQETPRTIGGTIDQTVQSLWDALADFDACDTDKALDHLLDFLCTDLDARNASWFVALRARKACTRDPTNGWRICAHGYLHASDRLDLRARNATRDVANGDIDITATRNIALAGRWRANRLVDLAEGAWFESAFYRDYYLTCGQADAIWCGCPISGQAEIYFGLYRDIHQAPFAPDERDRAAFVLRQLGWFFRRVALSHCLIIGDMPLTATERMVLRDLLTGRSEKLIAHRQGQSPHTTHDHVKSIYRKFGVSNRAGLMSLWLCHPAGR